MMVAAKNFDLNRNGNIFKDPSVTVKAKAELDRRRGADSSMKLWTGRSKGPPLDYRKVRILIAEYF